MKGLMIVLATSRVTAASFAPVASFRVCTLEETAAPEMFRKAYWFCPSETAIEYGPVVDGISSRGPVSVTTTAFGTSSLIATLSDPP